MLMHVPAAWRSGNIVGNINEVILRWARISTGMGDRLQQINHLSISPGGPGKRAVKRLCDCCWPEKFVWIREKSK